MKLAHFYLPAHEWETGVLRLKGEEARHCFQVTRHRVGDAVVVMDGVGGLAEAKIEGISGREVLLSPVKVWRVARPSSSLVLVQAVTKGETFEWILEKAVELGVQYILPVITDRTIVRLEGRDAVKKHDKWRRLVNEACKQCGQAWFPVLAPVDSLASAIENVGQKCSRLVASLQPQARPLAALRQDILTQESRLAVAIGPEGDFSEPEYQRLSEAGWLSWSLGNLVLRSETAAIYALSVLNHELNS